MGLSVRIELPASCNMQDAITRTRAKIGQSFDGATAKLSVMCLGCAAVVVEDGPAEIHSHDCPTACDLCTKEEASHA